MIAVTRAPPSEQPNLMKTRGDRFPGEARVLCKGNDRRKMPLRGGRSRRIIG